MYFYSREDTLVRSGDVEVHAAVAEARRWSHVRREVFVGTAHCRHAKGGVGEGRYWTLVQQIVSAYA